MTYDLTIIGSGPGGYVCAFRAAQLGLQTAIVEKDPHLGGTCLNVGCIPSKALLHSTHLFHEAAHGETHGILAKDVQIDVAKLMQRKTNVVDQLRKGVATLIEKRKITLFKGTASFETASRLKVQNADGGSQTVESRNVVIATGSEPVELPFLPFDGTHILSSTEAIALDKVPDSMVVIGGGAIGLEIGSIWARLGTKVTVVEFLPTIAAGSDADVSKLAERIFKKQGLKIDTQTKVTGAEIKNGKVHLQAERKGNAISYIADKVLVSVGRKPYTKGLGLDSIGIELDSKGRIPTEKLETSVPNVYAIGDVIEGPMLAHKAEEDGVVVAEVIAGKPFHLSYDRVPGVIYTEPEIATVGLTEQQAKDLSIPYKVGKFSLLANGRAIAQAATDGMAKIISHAETDRILGAAVIASSGSEMIASIVAHMEYGGSAEDIARTIHAHPTISESIKEAALAVDGNALHAL